ncbi:hypothetical protein [Methylorubrum populi]|uniref:Uncharacterized protein n=1 Tax=Methylorubrum populi TaxID=223967 RepID=A0A833J2T6_9HYPH|nr:hypothetical protein [Methylorubrum populi]KAB7783460.1 hypothetical protein F8B43_4022 [Methylorubrum populi]
MIAPEITDHALLRWMERVHGIDVEGWRALMRAEAQASLDAEGLRRVKAGPAFVIASDGSAVITYLSEGWPLNVCKDGIGIARNVEPEAAADAA